MLRPGGLLLVNFMNPDIFIFDLAALDVREELVVRHPLPFSTLDLPEAEQRTYGDPGPVEYSHARFPSRADRRPACRWLRPHPPGGGPPPRGRHRAVHARLHRYPRPQAPASVVIMGNRMIRYCHELVRL